MIRTQPDEQRGAWVLKPFRPRYSTQGSLQFTHFLSKSLDSEPFRPSEGPSALVRLLYGAIGGMLLLLALLVLMLLVLLVLLFLLFLR